MTDGYKAKRVLIWKEGNDMQGPCPDGFHVPTNTDRNNILDVFQGNLNTESIKLPRGGYRSYTDAQLYSTGEQYRYWSCVEFESGYVYALTSSGVVYQYQYAGYGYNIRPFKDTPVIPDSSWTALYSNKVYHKPDLGLISLSSDGTTWITIADKNLGATTVWNNGDTLSESNCGKYYQRGNNYGFDGIGGSNPTTSSTQVNAGSYGPGNYYESSTFIKGNSGLPYTGTYSNLRGGVTQQSGLKEYQVYPADKGWKPNANTTLYLPLNGDVKDPYNNVTYSWGAGSASYATWSGSTQAANFTGSNAISIGTSLDYTGGTGGYTVCFWFTTTSPSTEQRCSSNVQSKYFNICSISSSRANIYCKNSNGETSIAGTTTLSANTKYLFTATFQSGGTIKLYINGSLQNSASVGTFSTLSYQFGQWIGAGRTGNSEFWRGMIKDFIVESRIWSASDVLDYYNQTK